MINIEFIKNTYDLFYLPIDYVNNCNLGFAFINFLEPMHIILFYELFRGKKWKKYNSDKICELVFAKFQGKNELIAHFEKGKALGTSHNLLSYIWYYQISLQLGYSFSEIHTTGYSLIALQEIY